MYCLIPPAHPHLNGSDLNASPNPSFHRVMTVADVRRGVWLLRKARVRQERGQQESVDLSVLCLVPRVPLRTADCLFPDLRG